MKLLNILIPIYNDWGALNHLLVDIDETLKEAGTDCRIIVVNDGSLVSPNINFAKQEGSSIKYITILNLITNVGHQRAIAIGLSYINDNDPGDVLVMDGDGQDTAAGVTKLLRKFSTSNSSCVVFAKRVRRSENIVFLFCYSTYRALHLILTGIKVQFGNFSVVPKIFLPRLVSSTNLWNHYAATILSINLPYSVIEVERAKRISGESRMRFLDLMSHGLSAISVFIDRVALRIFLFVSISGLAVGVAVYFFSFPDFESHFFLMSIFFTVYALSALICLLFVINILSNRNKLGFLPRQVYQDYLENIQQQKI